MTGTVILLVDDHAPTRECWRSVLDQRGAQVIVAPSVRDACRRIESGGSYLDAVVLDYVLPDGDAIEIVRSLERVCAAPALILATAVPEGTARCCARRLRADRLVLKPVHADTLVQSLIAALWAKRDREEARVVTAASITSEGVGQVNLVLDGVARRLLRRAGLTSEARELALWNRVQGLSDADSARELGLKESSVRSIVAHACADIGADDCRDLLRVFLREVARASLEIASLDRVDARSVIGPVVDALAALPSTPLLRVGRDDGTCRVEGGGADKNHSESIDPTRQVCT